MKTVREKLVAAAFLLLLVTCHLPAAQAQGNYRFVKIDVPNAIETRAFGINARGDVVGKYTDAGGIQHGYLLRNGAFSIVDFPNSQYTTSARGINAHGDIVGVVRDADGNAHGFLLHDGQFTQIDYPGASSTIAFGINNSGDITGQDFTASGRPKGFILSDGIFRNISVPAGANWGVHGAQDNGRVMVGDMVLYSDFSSHGFLRNRPGDVQLIDGPGTIFPCTFARGINERGDVAGAFAIVNTVDECNSTPPAHGFLLRQGEYTIIDFPASPDTFVTGINDDGVIVGLFTDKKGHGHGFKAVPKN